MTDKASPRPDILVVDNYDSFTWNLVHYLEELGAATRVVRNDEKPSSELIASRPDGIVLSPGPCTPKEAGICLELVKTIPDSLPMLGVCLGHQSIAEAFGGEIVTAQSILHGKTSAISHFGGDLFEGIPEMFTAVRYHSLSAAREGFPLDHLSIDAKTEDGEIMALSHVSRPVYGVQFHPESIGSEYGHLLLNNFLRHTKQVNCA